MELIEASLPGYIAYIFWSVIMSKQDVTYAVIRCSLFGRDVTLEYDFALINGKTQFKAMVEACIANEVDYSVAFSQTSIQGV